MQTHWTRRRFLGATATAAAGLTLCGAATHAIDPISRKGKARMALGLAAYSFHDYFIEVNNRTRKKETRKSERIDLFQFMDFCANHGCHGTELTSYFFPPKIEPSYLLKLRHYAFLKGLSISGTAVKNTFTLDKGPERDRQLEHVKTWIRYTAMLGASHIRLFAGKLPEGMTMKRAIRNCIEGVEECAEAAGRVGVFLGLENHGGIVAEPQPLVDIVKAVKSPWVGINLDTGNFVTKKPYKDLEQCAPYAINVQVKVSMHPEGKAKQPADFKRLIKILRDVNYQGYVVLEYEEADNPFKAIPPYLKQLDRLID